jgi:hypothetical protein
MRYSRLGRCLPFAALLLGATAGCQALPWYRPVVVLARDADTKKPIPGASARLSYPLAQSGWPPWDWREVTGEDGVARLRASPQGNDSFLVEVTAEGYLPEAKLVPVESVRAIAPAQFFEAVERRPVTLNLDMIADQPIPMIELVVPTGYRGLVEVELHPQQDVPCSPGQRTFRCVVLPSGSLQAPVPALLERFAFPHFSAAYADGTPLRDTAKDMEIGFWQVKVEGHKYTFLVGTSADHALYHPEPHEGMGQKSSSSGGNGRGRGRGNRHGPSSTSDS